MQAGDSTPINIDLADGKVLRFSCTALPDGGRMLSYTPVTDLVPTPTILRAADYYRSLRAAAIAPLPGHARCRIADPRSDKIDPVRCRR